MVTALGFVSAALFVTAVKSMKASIQNACTIGYVATGFSSLIVHCIG